jgi:hypothetical protein
MATSASTQLPSQAFNDVLAKMMQAQVNEGGPPPALPGDTPVEEFSPVHRAEPEQSATGAKAAVHSAIHEFERKLNEKLEWLRHEIHEMRIQGASLVEAPKAEEHFTEADLEATPTSAHEQPVGTRASRRMAPEARLRR